MAYAITSQFRASQKAAPYVGAAVASLAVAALAIGIIGIVKGKFYLVNHQPLNMPRSCAITLIAIGSADLILDLFSLLEVCIQARKVKRKEDSGGEGGAETGFVGLDGQRGVDYTKK